MSNSSTQDYLQKGLSLAGQNKWEEAITIWQKATALEPSFVDAHFNIGVALRRCDRLTEAIEKYIHVLSLAPRHFMAHFSLGNIYLQQQQIAKAIQSYCQAIAIAEKPDFYFQLGIAYHQNDGVKEAIQCFKKVLELDPHRQDAQINLTKLSRRLATESKNLQNKSVQEKQQLQAGFKLYEQGNYEGSVQAFLEVIKLNPLQVDAHYNLSLLYKKTDRFVEAKHWASQAIELAPKHLKSHRLLADILSQEGQVNAAISHYLQAIAIEPGDQWTRYALRATEWQREVQLRLRCHPQQCKPQEFAVLHVGCGPKNPRALATVFRTIGWREVRLDIDPGVNPDVIGSITDLSAVADNSMDALYSSHNLEHIFRDQVPIALSEFFRVLKPGGLVLITLPDLQTVAKFVAEDKLEEPIEIYPNGAQVRAIEALYGPGNGFMLHRTGFTAKTLKEKLVWAGFYDIEICREGINLWAKGYKS